MTDEERADVERVCYHVRDCKSEVCAIAVLSTAKKRWEDAAYKRGRDEAAGVLDEALNSGDGTHRP